MVGMTIKCSLLGRFWPRPTTFFVRAIFLEGKSIAFWRGVSVHSSDGLGFGV